MIMRARERKSAWLFTGMSLIGLVGIVAFAASEPTTWLSFVALVVAVMIAGFVIAAAGLGPPLLPLTRPTTVRAARSRGEPAVRAALLVAGVVTIIATALVADRREQLGLTHTTVAAVWLLSLAIVFTAAWWRTIGSAWAELSSGRWRVLSPSRGVMLEWTGMTAVAALPRLLLLDRFPTVLDSDESAFLVRARASQAGEPSFPFDPGWYGNPNLYAVVQGWLAQPLGGDVAAHRTLTALVGTIGVLATWRLGRHLVGRQAAAAGAILLATMPLHLHMSRVGLNNITDPTTVALALLFLARSVRFGRSGDAVMCGITLGLGFFGYFGGRAIPGVVLVTLVAMILDRTFTVSRMSRIAGWLTMGFLAAAMPLIIGYRSKPGQFSGHLGMTSTFSRERLFDDPIGLLGDYIVNLRDGLMYPLAGNMTGYFRHEPPYLGWATAILLLVGVSCWVSHIMRHRDTTVSAAMLLVPWVLLTAGIALTTPIAGQRLGAITPLFALAAGSGLVMVALWVLALRRPASRPLEPVVIGLILVTISLGNLRWMASEDRQHVNYGDSRTTAAWDIGWRASRSAPTGAAPSVLLAGPPFVFTGGFHNLEFLAPDLEMADVADPIDGSSRLTLPEGAMLVIVPERTGERCAAKAAIPDARVAEARARDGTLLYTAIYREPLEGWSTAETPAGTTFAVVTDASCDDASASSPAS
jgi:hypothetical protein